MGKYNLIKLLFSIFILLTLCGSAFAEANMVVREDLIEGDYEISVDTIFRGIVQGNVTVKTNVRFVLDGIIVGSLTIEQGAFITINGIVGQDVINQGGSIEEPIEGIVKGVLR